MNPTKAPDVLKYFKLLLEPISELHSENITNGSLSESTYCQPQESDKWSPFLLNDLYCYGSIDSDRKNYQPLAILRFHSKNLPETSRIKFYF